MKQIKLTFWGSVSKDLPSDILAGTAKFLDKLIGRADEDEIMLEIISGCGDNGVIGMINNMAISAGLKVYGYTIPEFEELENNTRVHKHGEVKVFETIDQREEAMVNDCDAIIIMPGGFGTMRELFCEIIRHDVSGTFRGGEKRLVKPIFIYNMLSSYSGLEQFLYEADINGLLRLPSSELLNITDDPDKIYEGIKKTIDKK